MKKITDKLSTHLPIILILFLSGILSFFLLSKDHRWSGDTAGYMAQAKSVVDGRIPEYFKENRSTIDQSNKPLGPYLYPWVFPLLLAAQIALFGESLLAMKGLLLTLYLLFLTVLWYGFREKLDKLNRFILVALFAFNPVMLAFLNSIMSDIPFLLFSTVTVLLIGRIFIQSRKYFSKNVDLALLGALIAFCFFTRSNGILLLPVLLATQVGEIFLVEKKKFSKQVLWEMAIPYVSFFAILILWRFILPAGGGGHLQYLKEISLARTLSNLEYYLWLPAEFFSTLPNNRLFYGACLTLFLIGVFKTARQDYPIILYFFFTMALYIPWPLMRQGLRFILPILPFFVYFVLAGLRYLQEKSIDNTKYLWRVFAALLILIIVFQTKNLFEYAKFNMLRNRRMYSQGPYTETAREVFSFIQLNVPAHAIIAGSRPRAIQFFTKRAVLLETRAEVLDKADYILIDKNVNLQIPASLIDNFLERDRIKLIFQNPEYSIYKVNKI